MPLGLLLSCPLQRWLNSFQLDLYNGGCPHGLHSIPQRDTTDASPSGGDFTQRWWTPSGTFFFRPFRPTALSGSPWWRQPALWARMVTYLDGRIWHPNPQCLELWVWPLEGLDCCWAAAWTLFSTPPWTPAHHPPVCSTRTGGSCVVCGPEWGPSDLLCAYDSEIPAVPPRWWPASFFPWILF